MQINALPDSGIGLRCGKRSVRCREGKSPAHLLYAEFPTGSGSKPPDRLRGRDNNLPGTTGQDSSPVAARYTASTAAPRQATG